MVCEAATKFPAHGFCRRILAQAKIIEQLKGCELGRLSALLQSFDRMALPAFEGFNAVDLARKVDKVGSLVLPELWYQRLRSCAIHEPLNGH